MAASARLPAETLARMPLPLAQLYRRAEAAKTPLDQHHYAFYLGEAAIKLAACLRVGAVVSGPLDPGGPLAASLENLCAASLGQWVGFLRDCSRQLRRTPSAPPALAEAAGRLQVPRPLPAVRAFAERVSRTDGDDEAPPLEPAAVGQALPLGLLGFLDLLVAYRNQVIGHGAQRRPRFYAEVGPLLLAAVAEALAQDALFAGYTLAVARPADEPGRAGPVRWVGLRGAAGLPLSPDEVGPEPDPADGWARAAAGRLFFVADGSRVPVHPLVVYVEDRFERERVGFLNRTVLRRSAAGEGGLVRRVEYLDYNTGEQLREVDARVELADLLTRLRGRTAGTADVDTVAAAADPPAAEVPLAAGDLLGGFELEAEIGRGAMGVVYRGRQVALNRLAAVKVLPPALAADPVALARFRAEVAALGRCEHPNLVKVFYASTEGDRHFYSMELIDGAPLADVADVLRGWRAAGPLRPDHLTAAARAAAGRPAGPEAAHPTAAGLAGSTAPAGPAAPGPRPAAPAGDYYRHLAALFAAAADAVAHLHDRGVRHRDIKPSNVMLTADGRRMVVMDLGLAQLRDRSQSLTRTGAGLVGTLRYAAPEQLQTNRLDTDERADIYALGATLYELATLRPVFDGDTEERLLAQVLRENPRPPRQADPAVPADLAAVIAQCLEKVRSRRYATARDLADDLRRFAAGQPVHARPAGAAEQLRLWARRNPVVAGLGAAVAALLVLAAGGSTAAALMIDSARREAEGQRQEARDRAAEADLRADELAATNTRLGAEKQRAEQALADLRQREEEVRTQKRLVGEQEKKVAEQREKVLEYVGFARGTVDHFYRKVSGDPDLKGAGMVALRKDLLEKARKFYERLLDDRDAAGAGVISQEDLADVLLHLAELSREYDSKEAAVKLYREAVAVLEELVKKNPQNVEKLSDLSGGYIGLGQALADTGKPREAEQALASGQRLLERIGRTGEVTPINLTDRASVHVNKANVLTREGKLADARAELDEALKIRHQLADENPKNPLYQYQLGIAYTSLAAVHGTGKEFDAAYGASRRALDHLDRAGKLGPVLAGDEDYQANLAMACMNYGQSALSTGRVGEAPPLLDRAREVQQRLVAARPRDAGRVLALAQVYRNYVHLALLTDDPDRALEMSEKAIGLVDQLTPSQRAENWLLEAEVGSIHFQTGTVLYQEARFRDALDRFDRAADSFARVLKKIPGQPNAEAQLRGTLAGRAGANLALGKYDDALRDCDGFEKSGTKGAALLPRATALAGKGDHKAAVAMLARKGADKFRGDKDRQFELAGFYAAAAGAARNDAGLDPAEQRALFRQYAGTAAHLLTTLAENNYFRKKQRLAALKGGKPFDAVRSLPEVTKLIADAEEP